MSVRQNARHIESLFMETIEICNGISSIEAITDHLDTIPPMFRSLAYESASFYLGYKDLISSDSLKNWYTFYSSADKTHEFHILIGLGWSIAKSEKYDILNSKWIENEFFRAFILDGFGYYMALYKGRKTILNKQVPEWMNSNDQKSFDLGIGRRLWYLYNDDLNKLDQVISDFEPERIPYLVGGIGSAFSYVSGFSDVDLQSVRIQLDPYWKHFVSGATYGFISRSSTEYQLNELNEFINKLYDRDVMEIEQIVHNFINDKMTSSDDDHWFDSFSLMISTKYVEL